MSASIFTTVIGLEAVFGSAPEAVQRGDFQRVVATVARQFGTPVAEGIAGNSLQMTVVLAADAPVAAALRRLSASMDELLQLHPTAIIRLLAHHGVVFPSDVAGRASYMGSAIRSVLSFVRRLEDLDGLFATRDFAAHVASWEQSPIKLVPVGGMEGLEGLSEIRFNSSIAQPLAASGVGAAIDPALLQYIKRRLAVELGPFAAALVDSAQRAAPTALHLIKEVSSEIEEPAVRKRFEADVEAFLKKGK